MKKVSLIIPVYQLEKVLPKCLDSVCSQTHWNLEILLIDDGSTDRSGEICLAYAAKDPRVRYLHHDNHGVSYTRNRGIREASGNYLMFIDGDDWISPDMVAQYIDTAESSGADVVIGGITIVHEDSHTEVKLPPCTGCFENEIWDMVCTDTSGVFGYVPNKMYQTAVLKDNQIEFDLQMYAQEDLDFALRAYGVCQYFCMTDCAGYYYRYVPGKRAHPYHHYIRNQMNMLQLASGYPKLCHDSREAVFQRIEMLIYIALYEAAPDEFEIIFKRCYEISGLIELFDNRCFVHHRWLMCQFSEGNMAAIKVYFAARKWISRKIHRIRSSLWNPTDASVL